MGILFTRRSLFLSLLIPSVAKARIPSELGAIVVEAPSMFGERVFDLGPAIALAKAQKKPLFIYLGANDCPPCRQYSDFLRQNTPALAPSFSTVVAVDVRTWLQGGPISFKCDDKTYTSKAWLKKMGGQTSGLRYPSFWLVNPDLAPIIQISNGLSDVMSIEAMIAILARK